MKSIPKISDTEWEIMRIVWAKHPTTASEVIDQLTANDPQWHPKTVRTLLARLVQKKAIGYQEQGRTYAYSPLVGEEECVAHASETFLDRVFGGSLEPMLVHFVSRKKFQQQDLKELRQLLAKSATSKEVLEGRKP